MEHTGVGSIQVKPPGGKNDNPDIEEQQGSMLLSAFAFFFGPSLPEASCPGLALTVDGNILQVVVPLKPPQTPYFTVFGAPPSMNELA